MSSILDERLLLQNELKVRVADTPTWRRHHLNQVKLCVAFPTSLSPSAVPELVAHRHPLALHRMRLFQRSYADRRRVPFSHKRDPAKGGCSRSASGLHLFPFVVLLDSFMDGLVSCSSFDFSYHMPPLVSFSSSHIVGPSSAWPEFPSCSDLFLFPTLYDLLYLLPHSTPTHRLAVYVEFLVPPHPFRKIGTVIMFLCSS